MASEELNHCPQEGGKQLARPLPDSLQEKDGGGKPCWDPAGQPKTTAATHACTAHEATDPDPHCKPSRHAHSPMTNDPTLNIQATAAAHTPTRSTGRQPIQCLCLVPSSASSGDNYVTGSGLRVALPAPAIEG